MAEPRLVVLPARFTFADIAWSADDDFAAGRLVEELPHVLDELRDEVPHPLERLDDEYDELRNDEDDEDERKLPPLEPRAQVSETGQASAKTSVAAMIA